MFFFFLEKCALFTFTRKLFKHLLFKDISNVIYLLQKIIIINLVLHILFTPYINILYINFVEFKKFNFKFEKYYIIIIQSVQYNLRIHFIM